MRIAAFAVLAILSAALAQRLGPLLPKGLRARIGADAVEAAGMSPADLAAVRAVLRPVQPAGSRGHRSPVSDGCRAGRASQEKV